MTAAAKPNGFFISYRRTDAPDATGRIYDRLVSEFGKSMVFKDVDSIPLGQDFRGRLNDVVGGCTAVLAIIGPRWSDIRDASGQRRLDDVDDFVRIELEAALAREIPVVPVLVGHAPMPGPKDLPTSLTSLAYRQSIEVRPDPDFHNDATRLVLALRQILDPTQPADPLPEMAPTPAPAPAVASPPDRRLAWMTTFAAVAAVAAAALGVPGLMHLRETPPPETRVDIVTPLTKQPSSFALSPDGRQIAFVADDNGVSRLWLRSLSAGTARPLPGTEGATFPFWSPDSRSLAFTTGDALKRLDLEGGQPRTLAAVQDRGIGPGAWSKEGIILLSQAGAGTLSSIAASGGEWTEVIKSSVETSQPAVPVLLPDGRQFLFAFISGKAGGIYLGALDGRTPVSLNSTGAVMGHLPSGWMLSRRQGALVAQKLDPRKATLVGEPVTVAELNGVASVSESGNVAYRNFVASGRQLTWFDRSGVMRGSIGEAIADLNAPRLSPDGRRVAVGRSPTQNTDVWLLDGERTSRFTFDPAFDGFPVWSPDGGQIAFASISSGIVDLYVKSGNGAGVDALLAKSDQNKVPNSWSADGRFLLYFSNDPQTKLDLWVVPMVGDRKPFPFLKSRFSEAWGEFSPDGRWVTYQSDESGSAEIYIRPFVRDGSDGAGRAAAGGQWQVSTEGGSFPAWGPDGKEVYYLSPLGWLMAVPIAMTGAVPQPGTPVRLFQPRTPDASPGSRQGRPYDIGPDGRILVNIEKGDAAVPITLLQNWDPERPRAR